MKQMNSSRQKAKQPKEPKEPKQKEPKDQGTNLKELDINKYSIVRMYLKSYLRYSVYTMGYDYLELQPLWVGGKEVLTLSPKGRRQSSCVSSIGCAVPHSSHLTPHTHKHTYIIHTS
jgi:hypothetical protein